MPQNVTVHTNTFASLPRFVLEDRFPNTTVLDEIEVVHPNRDSHGAHMDRARHKSTPRRSLCLPNASRALIALSSSSQMLLNNVTLSSPRPLRPVSLKVVHRFSPRCFSMQDCKARVHVDSACVLPPSTSLPAFLGLKQERAGRVCTLPCKSSSDCFFGNCLNVSLIILARPKDAKCV